MVDKILLKDQEQTFNINTNNIDNLTFPILPQRVPKRGRPKGICIFYIFLNDIF